MAGDINAAMDMNLPQPFFSSGIKKSLPLEFEEGFFAF